MGGNWEGGKGGLGLLYVSGAANCGCCLLQLLMMEVPIRAGNHSSIGACTKLDASEAIDPALPPLLPCRCNAEAPWQSSNSPSKLPPAVCANPANLPVAPPPKRLAWELVHCTKWVPHHQSKRECEMEAHGSFTPSPASRGSSPRHGTEIQTLPGSRDTKPHPTPPTPSVSQ